MSVETSISSPSSHLSSPDMFLMIISSFLLSGALAILHKLNFLYILFVASAALIRLLFTALESELLAPGSWPSFLRFPFSFLVGSSSSPSEPVSTCSSGISSSTFSFSFSAVASILVSRLANFFLPASSAWSFPSSLARHALECAETRSPSIAFMHPWQLSSYPCSSSMSRVILKFLGLSCASSGFTSGRLSPRPGTSMLTLMPSVSLSLWSFLCVALLGLGSLGVALISRIASFDHLFTSGFLFIVLTLIAGPPDASTTMCSPESFVTPSHVPCTHLLINDLFLVVSGLLFGFAITCSPISAMACPYSFPDHLLNAVLPSCPT